MERIDKKIAENTARREFLRKRIQADKEELARLDADTRVLEHSQLAAVFSCEVKDVNSLVTHDTRRRLKNHGITDEILEGLASGKIKITEENNANKIF